MRIVSKKNIYLLLLFIICLLATIIVPTYAKFGSNYTTEEDVVGLLLDFDISISNIEEYEELTVNSGEYEIFNVQITNNTGNDVYYGVWYNILDTGSGIESISVGRLEGSDVSTNGLIEVGEITTVTVIVVNNSSNDATIDIGINSSTTSTGDIEYLEGNRLITDVVTGPTAYAVYSEDDTSLSFYKTFESIEAGDTYNDKTATAVYTGIETDTYLVDFEAEEVTVPWYSHADDITSVEVVDTILPVSTIGWFADFINCSSFKVENLVTSKVTDMSYMFINAGQESTTFELDLSNWDTSKVVDMSNIFNSTGSKAVTWSIGDISNWDVSNVANMEGMFDSAGSNATMWSIGNISNWDTSSVTSMKNMFSNAGMNAEIWGIGDISNWDTSNVISMENMFNSAGKKSPTWDMGDLSAWNTSNVINMAYMFYYAGANATSWYIGDISSWDTMNVIDMSAMFNNAGISADYSLDLSSWNVNLVNSYTDFNLGVESKIMAPIWIIQLQ